MDINEIPKMKVADLKKELKDRNLAVTGNKTDLIERLQQAVERGVATGKGEEDEEFDEEEILGTPAPAKGTPASKKRLNLKRTEPSTPVAAVKVLTKPVVKAALPAKGKENEDTGPTAKKVIKISEDAVKSPEARAERFGLPPAEKTLKDARAARFGVISNGTDDDKKSPSKLSTETVSTDLVKLKSRAERFGEVTSKTLNKVTELTKKKSRQERFASTTPSTPAKEPVETSELDLKIEAAKEARKGKFEPIIAPGAKTVSVDAAQKKRAERFAAK